MLTHAELTDTDRSAQLETNLAAVRDRIAQACQAADRSPDEVRLVAVTKFFPALDAAILAALGVSDLGESRDQEAAAKAAAVAGMTDQRVDWHFVGRLQTNKARSVAGYASFVHSVDRVELLKPLATGAAQADRQNLGVFVQVSLDGDVSRGGVVGTDVLRLAGEIVRHESLRLQGVMAIAPLGANADRSFADLAVISARLSSEYPGATMISAGMSGDLEAAIRRGATHVRIGTALLGRRAPTFG
ncbi:YggS family pyridoxal phosphate-dependent enzyme [Jatrophihabitans sp. DSM 45814]